MKCPRRCPDADGSHVALTFFFFQNAPAQGRERRRSGKKHGSRGSSARDRAAVRQLRSSEVRDSSSPAWLMGVGHRIFFPKRKRMDQSASACSIWEDVVSPGPSLKQFGVTARIVLYHRSCCCLSLRRRQTGAVWIEAPESARKAVLWGWQERCFQAPNLFSGGCPCKMLGVPCWDGGFPFIPSEPEMWVMKTEYASSVFHATTSASTHEQCFKLPHVSARSSLLGDQFLRSASTVPGLLFFTRAMFLDEAMMPLEPLELKDRGSLRERAQSLF